MKINLKFRDREIQTSVTFQFEAHVLIHQSIKMMFLPYETEYDSYKIWFVIVPMKEVQE